MPKKRMTLTIGPASQKLLSKLARKYSLETNTSWTSQDVLERATNTGIYKIATQAYPKGVVTTLDY